MIKPKKLREGDKVAIVSLSRGILGEKFVEHEVRLLEKRLREDFRLEFEYMKNARRGMEFLEQHPEARAEDLKQAFLDPTVKAIWSAIGGEDTFRTLPYLMNEEFKKIVQENPKVFIGFSDTTNNHLMLYKIGLRTFYGPALLTDLAEFSPEMLPYTKDCIRNLFNNENQAEFRASPVWYRSREDFGPDQVGVLAEEVREERGYEFLGSKKDVRGRLLGGCLESLYEMREFTRFPEEQRRVFERYPIFPEREEWRGKVLFIETSEEVPEPEKYEEMVESLEKAGVFEEVVGVLVGKPMDEKYIEEYREISERKLMKYELPIVFNMNFGHAAPRMIVPYGAEVEIDPGARKVRLSEKMLED